MSASLTDRTILITSGPTHAPIDAVRFISNRSTGRLGVCVAREVLARGGRAFLLHGPGSQRPEARSNDETARLAVRDIETVEDLIAALGDLLRSERVDAVVHAMAVLDYVPAEPSREKMRSGMPEWTVKLVRTPKVIARIREISPDSILVGFKLESAKSEAELVDAARALAARSGAALVVANDLTQIAPPRHPALLVAPDGTVLARPGTKEEIAARLCDWLGEALHDRTDPDDHRTR